MTKKSRIDIPQDVAASVLFASDRTCCVCNVPGKPVQLHHIDDNPGNNSIENLAVLCFVCHRETQICGGFDRKLDAPQIRLYKENWVERVAARRAPERSSASPGSSDEGPSLRYVQIEENSAESMYSFEADYALVKSRNRTTDRETNVLVEAFITRLSQQFRANAVASAADKASQKKEGFGIAWDHLSVAHSISLFTPNLLSLEFQISSYYAGAAHPNTSTEILNFRLAPSMRLEIHDLFKRSSNYLEVLSDYCVEDLHKQQPQRWHDPVARIEELKTRKDDWILRGAGPRPRNFERISLRRHGIVVHFDPYQVDCYASGKYEVSIPLHVLRPIMEDEIASLLSSR